MSDVQVFVMPDKNRVEVYADGRVVYVYQDSQDSYSSEADISSTKLGGLLRGCLLNGRLEGGLLEAGSQESPLNVTLCNVMKGKGNDNESNVKGHQPQRQKNLLRQETMQTLLSAGIPAETVRYFGSLNGCADALNNSANPIKAAQTMMGKPSFSARLKAWVAKNPAAEGQSLGEGEEETVIYCAKGDKRPVASPNDDLCHHCLEEDTHPHKLPDANNGVDEEVEVCKGRVFEVEL